MPRLATLALAALAGSAAALPPFNFQLPFGSRKGSVLPTIVDGVRSFGQATRDELSYELIKHPDFATHSLRLNEIEPSKAGLCDSTVKSYAGYLDVDDKEADSHLFTWIFESRNDPANDPVILWLNGGPGCSSTTGLLFELGPCSITANGTKTVDNPYSWTESATVIFLDQPIAVGYSYGSRSVSTSPEAARDVYAFLQLFYAKFPKFSKLPFHITGESYAGRYIPVIAHEIYENNNNLPTPAAIKIPLASLAIGNGLTDPYVQFAAMPDYACEGEFKIFDEQTCESMRSKVPRCQQLTKWCYNSDSRFACVPATLSCWGVASPIQSSGLNPYNIRMKCDRDGEDGPLCYKQMEWIEVYMNDPEVKKALGVSKEREFQSCNMAVNQAFSFQGDVAHDSPSLLVPLLEKSDVRVLIYAGDLDFLCNYLGNQRWVEALEWSGKADYNKAKFHNMTDGNGSTVKSSDSEGAGKLTYLRVRDAGHMVPYDQPEVALTMIQKWVNDERLW